MFQRAGRERVSKAKKDIWKPKDSYDWLREELLLMKARESAFLTSLEEGCVLLCEIAEEVHNPYAIQDSVTGMLYLRRLLNRMARWKRNIENPFTRRRGVRMFDDSSGGNEAVGAANGSNSNTTPTTSRVSGKDSETQYSGLREAELIKQVLKMEAYQSRGFFDHRNVNFVR